MTLYKNKYRIASARAPWWDYGQVAAYLPTGQAGFITICTQDRSCYFGDVVNGSIRLSHAGVLADVLWYQIPHHARHIELGAFVVMPNHIHGILILNNADPSVPDPSLSPSQKRFRNPGKNTVSSIVGGYKSAVSRHANRLGIPMAWQSRFHDHIIRDDAEYQRINDYIESNFKNWGRDKFR